MEQGNQLFPVFFRLDTLQVLVVGGGFVGLEKVTAIFKNSSNARVVLVAPEIKQEIRDMALKFPELNLVQREFRPDDLENIDLVIAATANKILNAEVKKEAKKRKVLANIADTPDLCDFYLSSVVKKGDLKIAISTNGKSPTFAKRVREMLEDVLPENLNKILGNLQAIRNQLKGDFEYKVKKLDEITSAMRESDKNI